METQVAEQQQWHVAIGLADFVAHVSNLQHVVDMCNTAELSSIDRAKLKNFMQWGSFIEEVRIKARLRGKKWFVSEAQTTLIDQKVYTSYFRC